MSWAGRGFMADRDRGGRRRLRRASSRRVCGLLTTLFVLLSFGPAGGCGRSKPQLFDRDRGLSALPMDGSVPRERIRGSLLKGLNALHRDDLKAAVLALKAHLAVNPRSAMAHYHLGLIYMDEDRFELARRHLEQAWSLEPLLYGAGSNLGVLYLRNREPLAALRVLIRAIKIAPDDARLRNNFGNVLLRRGHWSAGIRSYQEAIKLSPGHATILYNYALALRQRFLHAEAEKVVSEALMYRPGFSRARALKVVCLQDLGRVSEAVKFGKESLKLVEPTPELYVALGRALLASGASSDGLEVLRAAYDLDRQHPLAVLGLAETLDHQGDLASARLLYRAYLKLPDRRSEDGRRVRHRLKAL